MEMAMNTGKFEALDQQEMYTVEGGIAPFIIYGGALLGSFAVGWACGYFFG